MVTIDKLELLDKKVKEAVVLIQELRQSNADLKNENEKLLKKLSDLEKLTQTIQDDQSLIEVTIQDAIDQLDKAKTDDESAVPEENGSQDDDLEPEAEAKPEPAKPGYYSAEDKTVEDDSVDAKNLFQSDEETDDSEEEDSDEDDDEFSEEEEEEESEDDDLFSSSDDEDSSGQNLEIF